MGKDKELEILTIYKFNHELEELLSKESVLFKEAQKNKNKEVDLKNGKKATEGEMWEAVRITGLRGEAGMVMKKRYPTLVKIAEERETKNIELHNYLLKEFGVNAREMKIADYMKLTEYIFEYKFNQINKKK